MTVPRRTSALCVAMAHSGAAELVLVQVTIAYAGRNTSPKKLKGKKVHTAIKEVAAVPLALLSSPC